MKVRKYWIRLNTTIQHFIVVVKKTLRYSNVFFYNHLCPNSILRYIIMESGIIYRLIPGLSEKHHISNMIDWFEIYQVKSINHVSSFSLGPWDVNFRHESSSWSHESSVSVMSWQSCFFVSATPFEHLNILNQDVKSRILRGSLAPWAVLYQSTQLTYLTIQRKLTIYRLIPRMSEMQHISGMIYFFSCVVSLVPWAV